MTDERFVFQEDVKERRKMKTGAMHKKGAKRVTNCKFPSDYLTRKEKEKLSGPVISIKMDQPYYDWKEFRKLPEGLQIEYLNGLINNYGARQKDLCEMFSITTNTMSVVCKAYSTPVKFKMAGYASHKMDDRWMDFITKPGFIMPVQKKTDKQIVEEIVGAKVEPTAKQEPVEVEETIIMEEKKVEKTEKFDGVDRLNLAMNGTKQVIISMLESVLGTNCDYAIKFDITKVVKGPIVYPSGIQEG